METKMMFVLYALAFASGAQCANIIPLTYATTTSGGRFDHSLPEYYSYATTRVKSTNDWTDGDDTIMVHNADSEGRSENSKKTIASATPSETDMELYGHERDPRHMRHGAAATQARKKNKESLMSKILPMLVMPFLVSSSLIPMMLTSLKFMLLKSLFVGKIAIVLLAINALWKSENRGGVYSHNVNYDRGHEQEDLHRDHYGYNGDEEYGVYVNGRNQR